LRVKSIGFFIIIIGVLAMLTACEGANSSSFSLSMNRAEDVGEGYFTISAAAATGHRNRTFVLTAEELANLTVRSTITSGELILTISQNGSRNGTEIVLDLSSDTAVLVDTETLEPGRIRFSLQYDRARGTVTAINWN
jgi:hypothetical protein